MANKSAPIILAVPALPGRRPRIALPRPFGAIARLLKLWRRRIAESDELLAMSERELHDLGISRYDAAHAAKQAFWKSYHGGL